MHDPVNKRPELVAVVTVGLVIVTVGGVCSKFIVSADVVPVLPAASVWLAVKDFVPSPLTNVTDFEYAPDVHDVVFVAVRPLPASVTVSPDSQAPLTVTLVEFV